VLFVCGSYNSTAVLWHQKGVEHPLALWLRAERSLFPVRKNWFVLLTNCIGKIGVCLFCLGKVAGGSTKEKVPVIFCLENLQLCCELCIENVKLGLVDLVSTGWHWIMDQAEVKDLVMML
jgi:hypothetical protein